MIEVTIAEAQEQLEQLIERVGQGVEVFLVSDPERVRLARIEAIEAPAKQSRPLGLFEGQFEVGPEFFEPLPEEELRLWNCEGDDDEESADAVRVDAI